MVNEWHWFTYPVINLEDFADSIGDKELNARFEALEFFLDLSNNKANTLYFLINENHIVSMEAVLQLGVVEENLDDVYSSSS